MPRIVTLRLNEKKYQLFRKFAEMENRPLSNFIETATDNFIENHLDVDEFEMMEIENNKDLQESLAKGLSDAKERKGKFV